MIARRKQDLRNGLLAVVAAAALLSPSAFAQSDPVDAGQALAERNCSRCHAVGRTGTSPLAIAPPFRTLHNRYPVESLAEALAEGIVVGHPEMPKFELDPSQIDAFIAYLKSLEDSP